VRLIRVIHPFHPWAGREFEFIRRGRSRDRDRVFLRGPDGVTVPVPATWTDAVAPDPFTEAAGGLVPFRMEDLAAVAAMAQQLRARAGSGAGTGVKEILS
jgi:hypothetical protein